MEWSNVSYSIYSVSFVFDTDCSASQADITIARDFIDANEGKEPPLARAVLKDSLGNTNETDFTGGQIECAQITINKVYEFTCGTQQQGKYDFKSVILHELGHTLGIAHCHESDSKACSSDCSNNVMGPILKDATARTVLQNYDKASVVSVYAIYHPFF